MRELLPGLLVGALVTLGVGGFQLRLERDQKTEDDLRDLRLSVTLQRQLSGIDLHGQDLRRIYLSHKILAYADLHGARLDGAVLSYADLRGADLSRAELAGATLRHAVLDGAQLDHADLRGADLLGARISGASLQGTSMRNAFLESAVLARSCLAGAQLQGARLAGADLRGAVLNRANLDGTQFVRDLRFAKMTGARYDADAPVPPEAIREPKLAAARPIRRPPGLQHDEVKHVVDGDTVEFEHDGPARLASINAPDANEPRGGMATAELRRILPKGSSVRYELGHRLKDDRTRDTHGRMLVFVWRGPKQLVNRELIEKGLAYHVRRKGNNFVVLEHRSALARAEKRARQSMIGLWVASCQR